MSNNNLNHAKKAKNDEFYTQKWDVEQELTRYRESFTDKAILCNCNDTHSAFFHYFYRQFGFLKLKQLICVNYNMNGSSSYALLYKGGSDSDLEYKQGLTKIPLKSNGDFRSDECIEFLKQSDIVVTNPPFSLEREFIKQLKDYHKQFLIIGNMNMVTYKEVFPLIMNQKMWLGAGKLTDFDTPDGQGKKVAGLTRWFTNMPVKKTTDQVVVFEDWGFAPHPKYDNYTAFEVSKVVDIPACLSVETDISKIDFSDWKSVYKDDLTVLSDLGSEYRVKINRPIYGVPITFVDKYNPSSILEKHNLGKEFDILGATESEGNGASHGIWIKSSKVKQPLIDGKRKYKRLFIRVKPGVTQFKKDVLTNVSTTPD